MKIADLFQPKDIEATRSQSVARSNRENEGQVHGRSKGENADSVEISDLARRLSQYRRLIDESDVDRQARVEEIKSRVQDGSYLVPSEEVAQSLVSFAQDESA